MSSPRFVLALSVAAALGFATLAPTPAYAIHCSKCKKAARSVSKAVSHAADQTVTNVSHVVEKAKTETTNLGQNTEEAVREGGRHVRRQTEVVVDAHKELLKGDLYEAQKTYVNGSVNNSVTTLQQSSMLRAGATIVAGVYGGPAAVGSLNGFLVYKTTGDNSDAWKAGFVTAGSSYLTGQISGFQAAGAAQIAGTAVANGVVTGAGTAIVSGDSGKFGEGFERGALGSLANTYFQHVTGDSPDARIPEGAPYPKDSSSFPTTDEALGLMDQIPRNRPWTGMETFNLDAPQTLAQAFEFKPFGVTEDSGIMMLASKIPGVNPGSVLHDYLAVQNGWTTPVLQLTIPPAFAIAGIAMHMPENDLLFDSAIEGADREKQ